MKRAPIALLAISFVLAGLPCASVGAEYPPITVKVTVVKVGDGVYFVQGLPGVASQANEGFNSNAGFAVTKEGVVVIDALGTPALGSALLKAIRQVTQQPVKRVILTHYHADHFYGLPAFQEAGATIWAHRAALAYFDNGDAANRLVQRSRDLFPWVDENTRLIRADRWLDKDESFILGGKRFDIVHLGPAHSPEDVVVIVQGKGGIVFSGDILFTGRLPFVGEADSKRWLQTFSTLLKLKPKLLVPGHGAVSHAPEQDLKLTFDYLTYLREVMGKAVAEFMPFEEAYAKTDWSRFSRLPAFDAGNRINAFGTYLRMEKEMLERK